MTDKDNLYLWFINNFSGKPREILEIGRKKDTLRTYKVKIKRNWYKVYSCLSSFRARNVGLATEVLKANHVQIPNIIVIDGKLIVAEWVEGENIVCSTEQIYERILEYQLRIHNVQIPNNFKRENSRFKHLEFITKRVYRLGRKYISEVSVKHAIKKIFFLKPKNLRVAVVHPDFIKPNIILTYNGLCVIDNEFLGIGEGLEYDVLTTSEHLFGEASKIYKKKYLKQSENTSLVKAKDYWRICRLFKNCGKAFYLEKVDAALEIYSSIISQLEEL